MSHPYSDLQREISREEYEADLQANPLDEDGTPRLSWEQLMAVPLKCEVGEWKGFIFYGDEE